MSSILMEIQKFGCSRVCITGGEPLLQPEIYPLLSALCDLGYDVSLETSGDISCARVDPRVRKIIDVKTPDSGEPNRFHCDNLSLSDSNLEYKFVICSERDFEWAERFSRENNLFSKFKILYSPSYGKIDPKWLAEKILFEKSSAQLQLQLHKYIWSPDQRGI